MKQLYRNILQMADDIDFHKNKMILVIYASVDD